MRTQRWINAEDLIAECVAKHPLALSPDDAVMAEWFDLHQPSNIRTRRGPLLDETPIFDQLEAERDA